MKFKLTVFTFVRPSETSKATGHTIARFVERVLGATLAWDRDQIPADTTVLALMPGASAYCNCRDYVAEWVQRVPRVAWIQDDYTQRPPTVDSAGESPWRAMMRERARRGLPPLDYWTAVRSNAEKTPGSGYVNWNALGYEPIVQWHASHGNTLFYYGVWRSGRRKFADRYFVAPCVATFISTKPGNEYSHFYSRCQFVPIVRRPALLPTLQRQGLGLVLEDEVSTRQDNSPPRRFYEMLSARLPMVFMPESVDQFRSAGFDVREHVAAHADEIPSMMKMRRRMLDAQQTWRRDFVEDTERQLAEAARRIAS